MVGDRCAAVFVIASACFSASARIWSTIGPRCRNEARSTLRRPLPQLGQLRLDLLELRAELLELTDRLPALGDEFGDLPVRLRNVPIDLILVISPTRELEARTRDYVA